ncbi:flagellar biosynthesis protein FlgI [Massilia sp. Root418]|jgi:flagellar P-ring protein precursor FlgI|uniref:flagellar basal body P-ring protein FlgI n=1 Tax=Massilia sp. Root418 TaxID=1736532 RepID=UPI0006FCBC82|nr:flagellar basal body P-ring protein FlgI [Massilia sp. Root418]KQW96845.1 flagellar biosynthesis protein FlgI [Massilia sp. Root418]
MKNTTRLLAAAVAALCLLAGPAPAAHAERLKDLASVAGVRQNQLMGYGLVIGLDGTGDQTTQTPFTVQTVMSMLQQMGITLPAANTLQLKNVAAVMVTTSLPAFAQPGQLMDVTVSSMGNAKSLRGGTLLMTPLKGADGQVYGMAQGNVLVGGVGAQSGGTSVVVNHLSVGRISGGATVERAVPSALGEGNQIRLELNTTDFSTASRVVDAINDKFGAGIAYALDGRVIRVQSPSSSDQRVAFIGTLENLQVNPAQMAAKVIMNARTGSVVMNQAVALETCAISHGNLTVSVSTDAQVSQPGPLSGGQTVVTQNANIDIKKDAGKVMLLKGGAQLADVVKALNAIGATPQDLLAILQAMKAAGALRAELEII